MTPNHLQLAAQVPARWLDTRERHQSAALSMKKVVWRAILEGIVAKRPSLDLHSSETGNARQGRRLGKLNDAAYDDWDTFLTRATERLGVDLRGGDGLERQPEMERRLQVFHVLRCVLGPVIETMILLDRAQWLREELGVSAARLFEFA